MRRLVFFVFLLTCNTYLYSCALCALAIPSVHVSVDFNIKENYVNNLHVQWQFSESFTKQLVYGYDVDGDEHFNNKELEEIKNVLIKYIRPKDYLLSMQYYDKPDGKSTSLAVNPKNQKFYLKNNLIYFEFDLPIHIKTLQSRVLKMRFNDDEGFFEFRFQEQNIPLSKLHIVPNINLDVAFFEFNQKVKAIKQQKKPLTSLIKPTNQNVNSLSLYDFLSLKLQQYVQKIKELFKKSKNDSFSLLSLMGISFLYGLFHAAGPGHGKTLVGSYFVASGGGYLRALWVCLRIGVIHVAGAFLLVAISMYGVEIFISKLLSDVSLYTSKIASIVIILIAFYMLYEKIIHSSHKHHCGCGCSHNKKQEWSLAFAAGIVPCPGTVVVFILAMTLGNYMSGFLSAIAMALGISTILFFAAILGNFIHSKTSHSFDWLIKIIEYFALVLLLILGVIMLISTF